MALFITDSAGRRVRATAQPRVGLDGLADEGYLKRCRDAAAVARNLTEFTNWAEKTGSVLQNRRFHRRSVEHRNDGAISSSKVVFPA